MGADSLGQNHHILEISFFGILVIVVVVFCEMSVLSRNFNLRRVRERKE